MLRSLNLARSTVGSRLPRSLAAASLAGRLGPQSALRAGRFSALTARFASTESSEPPKKKKSSLFMQFFRLALVSGVALAGYVGYGVYEEIALPTQVPADKSKPRLVVVGSGWASTAFLKTLDFSKYDVTVISARNYFLFTPLLPSTATGMIEHRSIMEPTRQVLRKKKTASTFVEGEVIAVDPYAKTVKVSMQENSHKKLDEGLPSYDIDVPYDKLVFGVGSTTNTFNINGVAENACFLKEIEDTQKIRKRIMDCMEAASVPGLPSDERRRLMHAVVVGAGPTGVEFAGELHDFVYKDMRKYNADVVKDFQVSLIEATHQILPSGFNKQLVNYAVDTLEREQIDVMTDTMVNGADKEKVYAMRKLPNGQKEKIEIPYGTFVWAGGVGVRSVIKDLFKAIPEQAHSRRGLKVDEYLRVKGTEDMWAIGDCADAGLAPTAQVASQEGSYVAHQLERLAHLRELEEQQDSVADPALRANFERHHRRVADIPQFQYSHQGSLAYIGSDKAVADLTFRGVNYAYGGMLTYVFWRSAYLSMVVSMRNKLLVALDWTKVLLFGRDISRE